MLSRQNSKLIQAFIAIILFFSLGLVIKYWPDTVIAFDQTIQESVRGQLPNLSTRFFKLITVIGNTVSQIAIAIMSVTFCYLKKWYPQARFIAVNAIISGICILSLKLIFQRVRPTLPHLVFAGGYSFPSGHSMGTFMIFGSIIILLQYYMPNSIWKLLCQGILGLLIFLIGLSRIYLGVHFPTDVLAGFILAYGILNLTAYIFLAKDWLKKVK
ncbi:TPA: phosphatase PAP2 family protein [Streptococcus agalactiae]|uniref:Phosphatase PAP2 family protein n=2 Tax=Bacteria TaxID=2 RepID=A0AAW6XXA4_STRAG|nr:MULTISPECIES: phosphatase PAP2 family protein [Streptococcus]EPT70751.1 phosphatase [Streptococcus agalactiae CCUG 38383]AYZ24075.1 phosphatase PAP2 family protein [Streptococcus agalactiae]EAO71704.1 PAP2 family protein [Streptococcus agalactiae 515]EMA8744783.1 phosphatase PAP2 family protein [Streptococcus agalactiae]EPT88251.1 phosphatase [Streptococcus agalactiae BSU188]